MFQLRRQQPADLPELIALAQRSWREVEAAIDEMLGSPLDRLATPSWSAHHEAVVRAACQDTEVAVIVAEQDDELCGFVASRIHPASASMSTFGEVEVIAVDPRYRRRGIGRALLDHAVAELRGRGVPVIMLATGGDEGHGPARGLYESAGFRCLPTAQYWLAGNSAARLDV